ncbi:MAG: tryptophan--tRNA ligase [Chlamydiota bacterium]|nr:tryptophan--tRNA ligase [Chlamydiota bacterium]
MRGETILTGDRPTGPLHLGHYVGSLHSRLILQEENEQYVMIADMQALTDHMHSPDVVSHNVKELLLDYLAVGLDPDQSTLFIQSEVAALSELTLYYLNLVTWNRLKHNPTVKEEIVQKGMGESVPAGFMTYPIAQAADITAFHATLVPVGSDQLPMIEQTNEIVRAFNRLYGQSLVEARPYLPSQGRLPGTDGKSKMGKSLGNAIYLSDPIDVVRKKVKKMYSDPHHLRVEDPGRIEGNPLFLYLESFAQDTDHLQGMKEHYQRGGLADRIVKDYLTDCLIAFLEPIQQRRSEYANDIPFLLNTLKKGSQRAAAVAEKTLSEVKASVGLHYFD